MVNTDGVVKHTSSFKYLGATLYEDGSSIVDIRIMITTVTAVIAKLGRTMCKS